MNAEGKKPKFNRVDLAEKMSQLAKLLGYDVDEQTYIHVMAMFRKDAYDGSGAVNEREPTIPEPPIPERLLAAYRKYMNQRE